MPKVTAPAQPPVPPRPSLSAGNAERRGDLLTPPVKGSSGPRTCGCCQTTRSGDTRRCRCRPAEPRLCHAGAAWTGTGSTPLLHQRTALLTFSCWDGLFLLPAPAGRTCYVVLCHQTAPGAGGGPRSIQLLTTLDHTVDAAAAGHECSGRAAPSWLQTEPSIHPDHGRADHFHGEREAGDLPGPG